MEDLLKHQVQYLTRQIKAADSIPALLTSALVGLDVIERVTYVLTDTDHTDAGYETAFLEAAEAWWVLSEAPTLSWPGSEPMTTGETRELAEALAGFVLVVTEAMLTIASRSADPGDRVACLRAAHHAGLVYSALK
jgi:hypothetical protein